MSLSQQIIDDLLATLPGAEVTIQDARLGPYWTVVSTKCGAGLAATQRDAHTPHGHSLVRWAGDLTSRTANELAGLLQSKSPMETGLGMASFNALLPVDETKLTDRNAAEEIVQRGSGKRVVIVGHFPFLQRVRQAAAHLDVLELDPGPEELPFDQAANAIPQADVVAITGTSLTNKTFGELIRHCRPEAFVLVLGPTTPLSPVLFDYGVDLIAGTQVIEPAVALATASQGAIFRQMRGVRLVTMARDD
ncbi:MAG: DUF364 domain-containing protein [Anaerolineae bacterium]|jgi:hypothetical protein